MSLSSTLQVAELSVVSLTPRSPGCFLILSVHPGQCGAC